MRSKQLRGPDNPEGLAPIGQRINQILEDKYVTQSWLSERSGVSASTISRIMNGVIVPRYDTMIRLAQALSIEPAELMRVSEEQTAATGRVAYIADQLQQLVDESDERRGVEILDLIEAQVRLLRGE